jgi:hypothetical protein
MIPRRALRAASSVVSTLQDHSLRSSKRTEEEEKHLEHGCEVKDQSQERSEADRPDGGGGVQGERRANDGGCVSCCPIGRARCKVRFGSLSEEQLTIVCFIRHFWCVMFRYATTSKALFMPLTHYNLGVRSVKIICRALLIMLPRTLWIAQVRLIVIGSESPHMAKAYRGAFDHGLPVGLHRNVDGVACSIHPMTSSSIRPERFTVPSA